MKSLGLLLAAVFLLSACAVKGPEVKLEPGEVKLEPVTVDFGGGSHGCPPGHAKKGWC